jgi:nucleoside-diphosphate-sugar epimerase
MRVAVTGASGFVGGAACAALVAAGHQVTGYGRRPRPSTLVDEVEYRSWDLTAGDLASPGPADVVLHCAAAVDDWAPVEQQRRVTVDGTRAALSTWPNARFVHLSSASVYPAWGDGLVTEADGPARHFVGPYARAKAEAEHVVSSAAAGGRRTLVLRPHAVYGAGDPTLLPRLTAAVRGRGSRRGGVLVLPGSRRTAVHLTSVALLADVCRVACESDLHGTVNVADAAPVPLGAAVDAALRAALGTAPRRVHLGRGASRVLATLLEGGARTARRADPPVLTRYVVSHLAVSRVLDLSRLRDELGVVPPPTDLSVLHRDSP